jgi:hypothetical protein
MDENVVKRYQLAQEPPTAALAAVERDAQCMHADEHGSKIPEIRVLDCGSPRSLETGGMDAWSDV